MGRSAPLWQQVRDDLRRRCATGEFSDAIPSEPVLAVEYGVSRHTIREGLRDLRADGTIISSPGRASRVGLRQDGRTDVQVDTVVDPTVAARLGLPPHTPLMRTERVVRHGRTAIAFEARYEPAAPDGYGTPTESPPAESP